MESLLNRTQRLETIGRLSAGIVHDLKNIFQPILLSTEILRRKLTDENDLKYIKNH